MQTRAPILGCLDVVAGLTKALNVAVFVQPAFEERDDVVGGDSCGDDAFGLAVPTERLCR